MFLYSIDNLCFTFAPTYMTQNELYNQAEQALRASLEILRSNFSHLDEKRLQQRPDDPKGWTILECFEHLNLHYSDYLPQIELAIHKAKAHQHKPQPDGPIKTTFIGGQALKWVKSAPGKRFKTSKRYNPLGRALTASALKSLIINIEKLLRIIQLSKEVDLNRTKIRFAVIPMFKFNLGNLLEFMAAHTSRHIVQASRLLD